MDDSFSPNEIFNSEKKVRLTVRYTAFVSFSITLFILVVVITSVLVASNTFVPEYLGIQILLLFLGGLALWGPVALVVLAFNWNMVVFSSEGIKFCGLTRRMFFKWKDIRSCSLRYERETKTNYNGKKTWVVSRILIFRLTPLEGEIQSMPIPYKPKLRFIFRDKKEEKTFIAFIQSIVDSFTIEPKDKIGDSKNSPSEYNYSWVLREE